VLALVVALLPSLARADIQKSGPEEFPGKFQVGFHPLGGQTGFNLNSVSGYKLTADFSGLLKSMDKLGLWLGGGFNYTAGIFGCYAYGFGVPSSCGHDLQFWVFVMLTMEKLVPKIPLVPFVRGGVGGDILIFSTTGGAFAVRVGGGVHYYILKNLGLGVETNFTFGPSFFPAPIGSGFYGNWDIGLGARFAF
jgi:hypothetical protein